MASCPTCGTGLRVGAKFCDECGAAVAASTNRAEYKQVTVMFADVVHSMAIAAQLGPERLREIMSELVVASTEVVDRNGGTLDKFTGDGIMAVFGAPLALEDHALRACRCALALQGRVADLAADVGRRDGVSLQVRVGLNSGQVIAGEIGSGASGYTSVGEQVGLAQRMESIAPPGGIMLAESTAKLVVDDAELGAPELLPIKGSDIPVVARRLEGIGPHARPSQESAPLVGRTWEIGTIRALLDEATRGAGSVITVVGAAGIGKSRLLRESAALATEAGMPVYTTFCEAHESGVPFRVVARLLRAAFAVDDLDAGEARAAMRMRIPQADDEDLLLLDDLLGIADPAAELQDIAAEARRRRMTALVNAISLAREEPAVYVIEDAHWIDEISEAMLADFLAVIPRTPSLVLITYRPEYHGALAGISGAQSISLRPLSGSLTAELADNLLGTEPSTAPIADLVTARAAGNPYFVEELIRDLAERGILDGTPGGYRSAGAVVDFSVPATLQATIAARIDRLRPEAKRALNAAAVIGFQFDTDLLAALLDQVDMTPLVDADLVDQVRFTPAAEYAFRHPLVRTTAYESQLRADRATLHHRLATAIQTRAPSSTEENAALIAEHIEAAGDLAAAFEWHMRAGAWSTNRDINAAHTSWRRACAVADRIPDDDTRRSAMRIAPRTLLCATAFRVGGSSAHTGFDELRELCAEAGDKRSLAIGMTGEVSRHMLAHSRESFDAASEHTRLLESIADPELTIALSFAALIVKFQISDMATVERLAQRVIDLAAGDPTAGDLVIASPLALAHAMRATVRAGLRKTGWREDFAQGLEMARGADATTLAAVNFYTYLSAIPFGLLRADAAALTDTAEALATAERSGDDMALSLARCAHGVVLVQHGGPDGGELLTRVREEVIGGRFSFSALWMIDLHLAIQTARDGDLDTAIESAHRIIDEMLDWGEIGGVTVGVQFLVETLLRRGGDGDLAEARAAAGRLAKLPHDALNVYTELIELRLAALFARAENDGDAYRRCVHHYLTTAERLGFDGHIAWARALAEEGDDYPTSTA